MGEFGLQGIESADNKKEILENKTLKTDYDLPRIEIESLKIREQKFHEQITELGNKGEELGFPPLNEAEKQMIHEVMVGNIGNEQKAENISRERELKRELNENDLIIPEGNDIENAEKLLKENGVPCKVEKYTKGVNGETGRVPAEFVLAINDPQNPDKPAPFEFVKKVFQFLQDREIVVRYAKNPEKAGADVEDENQG